MCPRPPTFKGSFVSMGMEVICEDFGFNLKGELEVLVKVFAKFSPKFYKIVKAKKISLILLFYFGIFK